MYALLELLDRLVPFNYVMPGQSENRILRPDHISTALNLDLRDVQRYWPERISDSRSKNIFSGAGFKTVNFVAEIPYASTTSSMVFSLQSQSFRPRYSWLTRRPIVEMKRVRTRARYKSRQSEKVRERLEGLHSGLQLPRLKD